MDKRVVTGITSSLKDAKITLVGVRDKPGVAAEIFMSLADSNINVDMIVQNISQDGIFANITFTVPAKDMDFSKNLLEESSNILNFKSISTN